MKNVTFNSLLSKTAQAITKSQLKSAVIATAILAGATSIQAADFSCDCSSQQIFTKVNTNLNVGEGEILSITDETLSVHFHT